MDLSSLKDRSVKRKEILSYVEYNNENAGFWQKINDFFVERTKITDVSKAGFFYMLSTMLNGGVSLVFALKSVALRLEQERFARIVMTIAHNVENGRSLSQSMRRFMDVFDESEIGVISSGESTAKLDLVLLRLAERLRERSDLSSKLWTASIYPIIVLIVLLLVSSIMFVWVFPNLITLFEESSIDMMQLPWATRFLIFLQDIFVSYWWLIVLLVLASYGFVLLYRSTEEGRKNYDYFKLNIPLLSGFLKKIYVYHFVDMFALLIRSSIPLDKAIEILGASYTNKVYEMVFEDLLLRVRKGEKLSAAIKDYSFCFPYELSQMFEVGEKTASIGNLSQKLSMQYKREIDVSLKKLTAVFEPLLIVVVGVFVAILAMAIMGPIFNIGLLATAA